MEKKDFKTRKYKGHISQNENDYYHKYSVNHRILTKEEEIKYCLQAQSGDIAARNIMMEHNLRLVISIAKNYQARSMIFDDFIQEGIFGLEKAIEKYNPDFNCRFSTYATPWIKQSIGRAIEKKDRIVRMPSHACNSDRKIRYAIQKLTDELYRSPTIEEISLETGINIDMVESINLFNQGMISLDVITSSETADTAQIDMIPDFEAVNPEGGTISQETFFEIGEAIKKLHPREKFVIERRFGLFDKSIWTLRDIAIELNLSRETIRNIEYRSLKKLKTILLDASEFENEMCEDY